MSLLSLESCSKVFGGLSAVDDVTLGVEPDSVTGLIGPNGAGKTTLFNLITGVYRPSAGAIRLGEESLVGKIPSEIARLGIARTFQNIRLFPNLSVLDNVRLAYQIRSPSTLWDAVFRTGRHYAAEDDATARARLLLDLFHLGNYAEWKATALAYGEQRRLEIARALATTPRLLLLDEPAAGMNPQEKAELRELIRRVRTEFQVTVLLIEHDMSVVMGICEKIYVLDYGRLIASGSPAEVRTDRRVIEAYLGESVEA